MPASLKRNIFGQVTEKTMGGYVYKYEYDPAGNLTKIISPTNEITTYTYNRKRQVLSSQNSNSGKIQYQYDLEGKLILQQDANSDTTRFDYDALGRTIKVTTRDEIIEYGYDNAGNNSKGKLTSVKDNSGITKYYYDAAGNKVKIIRQFEDYTIQFQNAYDPKNRLVARIYPDGTVAKYTYVGEDLNQIKITTPDGKVDDQVLVQYNNDRINKVFTKKFGNGVTHYTEFDDNGRVISSKILTSRQSVEQQRQYNYDTKGNIVENIDLLYPNKNQTFEYDDNNRLLKATGKYGELNYTYSDNGNLIQNGNIALSYADNSHPHAVTSIQKPSETISLEYDLKGNLKKKNNDEYIHSVIGRLSTIKTSDGQEFDYIYNYRGRRAKKTDRLKTEVTYYFGDGLYEIHKVPGRSDEHTLYFLEGNSSIAQWTRTDAVLPNIDLSAVPSFPSPFLSRIEDNYNDIMYRIDKVIVTSPNSLYLLFLLIPLVFYLVEKRTFTGYSLSVSIVTLLLVTCVGSSKKQFPFAALMMAGGINSETPGIGSNGDASSNTNSGNTQVGGSGGSSAGTPVAGFYFLHKDYLDSVTMVTDGKGEMVSGMDISTGKSVVDYKPYGEIDRKNSDGPDIFRYKYTGQEEDRETGLYYYKARYYDPEIGRFVQPDSYLNPNTPFGMNQYAYVDGNPIMNSDPTGHVSFKQASHMFGMIFKSLTFQRHHKSSPLQPRPRSKAMSFFHSAGNSMIGIIAVASVSTSNNCSNTIITDPDDDNINSETNPYLDSNYKPCDDYGSEVGVRDPRYIVMNERDNEGLPVEIKYYTPYDRALPDYNRHAVNVSYYEGGGSISRTKLFPMVVRTNRKYADPFTICENGDNTIQNCVFSGANYKFSRDSVSGNVAYLDMRLWKCKKSNKWQKPVTTIESGDGTCNQLN